MKKTAWFDRKFTFGNEAGMLPFYLERLNGSMARLQEKTERVPEDVLSNMLDGKWSVKQNIGHLTETDGISMQRITQIAAGISPMAPAVVQPGRDYNAMVMHDVLESFFTARIRILDTFTHVHEEALGKSSTHPRLNVLMNPVDLAYFCAEHDDHHIVRINEILAVLNP